MFETEQDQWPTTGEAVIEGIRKAAAAWPGRRYVPPAIPMFTEDERYRIQGKGACSYFEDRFGVGKSHACIVGESLYGLGLDPMGREPNSAAAFLRDWGISLSTEEALWVEVVQRSQDKQMEWGQVIELADEVIDGYRKTGRIPEAWSDVAVPF